MSLFHGQVSDHLNPLNILKVSLPQPKLFWNVGK